MFNTLIVAMMLSAPNGTDANWDCKAASATVEFCLDVTTAPPSDQRTKPFFVQGMYVDSGSKQVAPIQVRFDCQKGTTQLWGNDDSGKMTAQQEPFHPKAGTLAAAHLSDFCPGSN